MSERIKTGIFGLGPGSAEPATSLNDATIFYKEGYPEKRAIYTTSVGYDDLFEQQVPPEALNPMTSMRVITPEGTDFSVNTGEGYSMVDYPQVIRYWREKIVQQGASIEVLPEDVLPEEITVKEGDGIIRVDIQGGRYEFDSVIDATGVEAVISSQVEQSRQEQDFLVEFVCFGTFKGSAIEGELSLIFGPGGGISWANPSIYKGQSNEELVDVVFSGWGYHSYFNKFRNGEGRKRLDILANFIKQQPGFTLDATQPLDVTYGMIRSQQTPLPSSQHVYPVGEAAGAAKPFTGESFNRSLRSGEMAKDAILKGESPREYITALRKKGKGSDLFFSAALHTIESQLDGNLTNTANILGRWFNNGDIDDRVIRQIERLILEGKPSFSLMKQFVTDKVAIKRLAKALLLTTGIKLKGQEGMIDPKWTFDDLNHV